MQQSGPMDADVD